jgi:hypothetical protein
MEATIVRYQTSPEGADENERLVRAVFAELAESDPGNLQYATFRLADGVTFIHVAVVDHSSNPLSSSPAFAAFQSGLGARCVVPPNPSGATLIGQYNLPFGQPAAATTEAA